jgi:hypothetical protein
LRRLLEPLCGWLLEPLCWWLTGPLSRPNGAPTGWAGARIDETKLNYKI